VKAKAKAAPTPKVPPKGKGKVGIVVVIAAPRAGKPSQDYRGVKNGRRV
jgi:hypothetical protein